VNKLIKLFGVWNLFIVICLVIGIWSLSIAHVTAQGICGCQTQFNGVLPISCVRYWDLCDIGYAPSCSSIGNVCVSCTCTVLPTNTPEPTPTTAPPTSSPPFNTPTPTTFNTPPPFATLTPIPTPTTFYCCGPDTQCHSYTTQFLCINGSTSGGADCQWSCTAGATSTPRPPTSAPPSSTPVPTRIPPKVFCNPSNGALSANPGPGFTGIATSFGCVPYNAKSFTNKFFLWGIGIGGGIAILILVYAAFIYVTSGGDPKRIQSARELVIAVIGGIVLVIFTVLVLNYLGVNLLNLQGIGFSQ